MEDINILKTNIDERIRFLEQKIPVVEERYDHMNDLIKQNVSVLEKLDSTLQDNRIMMEHLSNMIDTTKEHVEDLDEEITQVGQQVDDLKDERNFNFIQWVKNNFVSLIVGATLLYYIITK